MTYIFATLASNSAFWIVYVTTFIWSNAFRPDLSHAKAIPKVRESTFKRTLFRVNAACAYIHAPHIDRWDNAYLSAGAQASHSWSNPYVPIMHSEIQINFCINQFPCSLQLAIGTLPTHVHYSSSHAAFDPGTIWHGAYDQATQFLHGHIFSPHLWYVEKPVERNWLLLCVFTTVPYPQWFLWDNFNSNLFIQARLGNLPHATTVGCLHWFKKNTVIGTF